MEISAQAGTGWQWTEHEGGVWTLPEITIPTGGAEPVSVAAVWTEEDGLQVSVEAQDGMIAGNVVKQVSEAMLAITEQCGDMQGVTQ